MNELWLDGELLQEGKNCLALHGLNSAPDDRDLVLIARLQGEKGPEEARDQDLLGEFRRVATGPETPPTNHPAPARLAYLEGRIHERAGRHREAIDHFLAASRSSPADPEPLLHLAECRRALGESARAEEEVRAALANGPSSSRDLWELWAQIGLVDLELGPEVLLSRFPGEGGAGGYGADLRWLLERLLAGEGVRINGGGGEYRSPGGKLWGADRFFLGGVGQDDGFRGGIEGSEDDTLYRSHRWFPATERGGYRLPLPKGTYRVTLYFVERWFGTPGSRRFEVLLEGRPVLSDYEPLARGFAVADPHAFDKLAVSDGFLDLDFQEIQEAPEICAFEVEPSG